MGFETCISSTHHEKNDIKFHALLPPNPACTFFVPYPSMTEEIELNQIDNKIQPNNIALFVTCLVNNFRPSIGFASVRLLQAIGYDPEVPMQQTCCGQPNYNNGDSDNAANIAKFNIQLLQDYDGVVVPSASCAGMIRNHYPKLLQGNAIWQQKASELADKTWELSEFIAKMARHKLPINATLKTSLTHHHSCSSLREIKSTEQVSHLLNHCLPNCTYQELSEPAACCGFGGTFCIKFNDISRHMGQNKLKDIDQTGARTSTCLDLGCIMQLESLNRENSEIKIQHLAELLDESLWGKQDS